MKVNRAKAMLLGGVASVVLSGQAIAQTAPQPVDSKEQSASDDSSKDTAIVVTGSRIQTGDNSPIPAFITVEKLAAIQDDFDKF